MSEYAQDNRMDRIHSPGIFGGWNMIYKELRSYQWMSVAADGLYFLSSVGNGLECYKIMQSMCDIRLSHSQIGLGLASGLYSAILYYEKKIIFVPRSADSIGIFDFSTHKWTDVMVPEPVIPYNDNDLYKDSKKFANAFVCGKKVCFIPNRYPGILVLSMDTLELRVESDWYAEFSRDMLFPGDILFPSGGCTYEGKIYVPSAQNNRVLEIAGDGIVVNLHSLGQDDTYYSCICGTNSDFWMAGGKKTITKWDVKQGKITEIEYPQNFQMVGGDNLPPFLDCIRWRQYVIFVPMCSNMFVVVNTDTNDVQGIPLEENFLKKENFMTSRFLIGQSKDDSFYMYDNFKQKLLYVNAEGKVEERYMKTMLEEMLELLKMERAETAGMRNTFSGNNYGKNIYEKCSKMYGEL